MGFSRLLRSTALCAVFGTVLGLSAAVFPAPGFAAPADDLKEATRLYQQNKLDAAYSKVNGFLVTSPKDPQGRFLKGLILTEQHKNADAIQIFTGLTEDFPELPEPYNNLAVLYASQGNYDKAKAALELAIHTHPSYATAHENLGDIYAQLARRAYDKALQLDKNNVTAQAKLAMVKDLFSAPNGIAPTTVAVAAAPAPPAVAATAPAAAVKVAPSAPAATVATAQSTATVTKPAPAPPKAPASDADSQITDAVTAWAKAWSEKKAAAYLAFYAPDFETPTRESRSSWEQQRRERIEKPKSISVTVKINSIKVDGNDAVVNLRQSYRSDSLKTSSTKTLRMVKNGEKWQIRQERVGS